MRRKFCGMIVALATAVLCATTCDGQSLYLEKTTADRAEELKSARWIETIEREIPPLSHDLGDQMPMIMWHGVGFAWVSRVCRIADRSQQEAPVMSRSRYRESLGELWRLKIHTMQVFNPMYDGYEELAIIELQDAVAAFDEMLGARTQR